MEIWKNIEGFPDYEVSSLGNVRSWKLWGRKKNDPPRMLQPGYSGKHNEYRKVVLSVDNKTYSYCVHTLVLTAFVGPAPKGMEARHLNGDGWDNRIENLEWATHYDNMQDKVAHGTLGRNNRYGTTHEWSKLTPEQVRQIRLDYATGKVTQQQLADQHNTSRANIGLIVNHKNWKKV